MPADPAPSAAAQTHQRVIAINAKRRNAIEHVAILRHAGRHFLSKTVREKLAQRGFGIRIEDVVVEQHVLVNIEPVGIRPVRRVGDKIQNVLIRRDGVGIIEQPG